MSDTLNWDEFRVVRAIAETHSLYGAAERLGLNHSTMFRRLTALEARLGFKLFERDRAGYRPTAAGEDMVALAMLMGDTIAEFERRVGSLDVQLTGLVRMNAPECLGSLVMPDILADLRAAHPGLQVELTMSDAPTQLLEGECDVALRVLKGPPPEDLASRRVAAIRWAVYATPSMAPPGDEVRANAAPWAVLTPNVGPPQVHRWVSRNIDPSRQVARINSVLGLAELAARGIGLALLPGHVAAAKPELRKVREADSEASADVWLLAAPQALQKARVRALFDFVAAAVERQRGGFQGETSPAV